MDQKETEIMLNEVDFVSHHCVIYFPSEMAEEKRNSDSFKSTNTGRKLDNFLLLNDKL